MANWTKPNSGSDEYPVPVTTTDRGVINEFGLTAKQNAVGAGGTQSISSGTVTKVEFTDSASDGDASSPAKLDATNNKVVIQEDGLYWVAGAIQWDGDASWSTGDRTACIIRRNGQTYFQIELPKVGTDEQSVVTPSKLIPLSANDDIELYAYHESGGSRPLKADGSRTSMSVAGGF